MKKMIKCDDAAMFMAAQQHFLNMRATMINELLATEPNQANAWQQLDVSRSPAHQTHELLNVTVWYDMPEEAKSAQKFIKPDLPWAEAHFQERVGGEPINPGTEHANWPYHAHGQDLHLMTIGGASAGGYRDGYSHNYMERMWATKLRYDDQLHNRSASPTSYPFTGYRYAVGDLADVVEQLRRDPTTRQAYLPIWFPEDTGARAKQRVPCSLGYHFIIRDGKLHVNYYLRSCEMYRHFTNDIYMAVRLGQWVRDKVEAGQTIMMGQLCTHIVSLHAFVGDVPHLHRMQAF